MSGYPALRGGGWRWQKDRQWQEPNHVGDLDAKTHNLLDSKPSNLAQQMKSLLANHAREAKQAESSARVLQKKSLLSMTLLT